MKKFSVAGWLSGVFMGIAIVVVICLIATYMRGGNGHNSVGNGNPDCVEWFEDTGIDVKNHQNRMYNIVKDQNGFLYYSSDVEGALAPVLNEFGLPTKDVELFD